MSSFLFLSLSRHRSTDKWEVAKPRKERVLGSSSEGAYGGGGLRVVRAVFLRSSLEGSGRGEESFLVKCFTS